jgi:hypothetical protein
MIDFILHLGLDRLIQWGPEGAAQLPGAGLRQGRKTPYGRNIKNRQGPGKENAVQECVEEKPRADPSSTGDWVLVKRALCKIPVLPGLSLTH